MPGRRTLGRKYPAILLRIASRMQNFEDSPAHRNEPPSFWCLAVWHKDHAVLPVQVLDAHDEREGIAALVAAEALPAVVIWPYTKGGGVLSVEGAAAKMWAATGGRVIGNIAKAANHRY